MPRAGFEPATSPFEGLYALAVGHAPPHRVGGSSFLSEHDFVRQFTCPRESHKQFFSAPILNSKRSGKDSNLQPPPDEGVASPSLYAPAIGREQVSCRTKSSCCCISYRRRSSAEDRLRPDGQVAVAVAVDHVVHQPRVRDLQV